MDYVYWDSNIFLSYLNQYPGRVQIIDALWTRYALEADHRIITASLSIAEVAYVTQEINLGSFDPQLVTRLDAIWRVPSVQIFDIPREAMYTARSLIRTGKARGWSLKPADAIHLATAAWFHQNENPITAFYTYDDLKRYASLINIPITEPTADQPAHS